MVRDVHTMVNLFWMVGSILFRRVEKLMHRKERERQLHVWDMGWGEEREGEGEREEKI